MLDLIHQASSIIKQTIHTIDSKSDKIQRNRLCVVKSTILDAKLGVGGKLFSSFSYNQDCSEVSIHVILL